MHYLLKLWEQCLLQIFSFKKKKDKSFHLIYLIQDKYSANKLRNKRDNKGNELNTIWKDDLKNIWKVWRLERLC